jgi:hypothetical protein
MGNVLSLLYHSFAHHFRRFHSERLWSPGLYYIVGNKTSLMQGGVVLLISE